jgi:hypothetical protein
MKYLLFFVLLVGVLITAGCVGGNKNTVVQPVTANIASVPDPIVGVWQQGQPSSECTSTFLQNFSFSMKCPGISGESIGTWSKVRENEYLVTFSLSGSSISYIYHPETDTVTKSSDPSVPLYRPEKAPTKTPTPTQTKTSQTVSNVYSGSSSSGSGSSSSGQCWVNGYYRKSGTWVNGYYRSC